MLTDFGKLISKPQVVYVGTLFRGLVTVISFGLLGIIEVSVVVER